MLHATAFISAGSVLVFHSMLAHRVVAADGATTRPSLFMMLGLRPTMHRPLALVSNPPTSAVMLKFDTNSARANCASWPPRFMLT